MLETTKKIIEEIEELKNDLIVKNALNTFEELDGDEFIMMQKLFKLLTTSEELMMKQAEMLTSINNKLNRLLSQNYTES